MGQNLLEDVGVVVLEVNRRPLLQRIDAEKRVPCPHSKFTDVFLFGVSAG